MKAKKYILYAVSILLLVLISSDVTFAAIESTDQSGFWNKLGSGVVNSLLSGMIQFAMWILGTIIGFVAGALTFAILLLSNLLDMVFIKVPYIGDILGANGDIAFVKNVQLITSIVLLFSVFIWLFLGGFNYIKSVFDQITMGDQAGGKINIFRDVILKFTVVLLVLSIPFSLPMFFKGVNTVSSGILKMEISAFDKEDQIIIASKPLTSMIELGLGIPAVEGVSSDFEENKDKEFVSIHNKKEGDGIIAGNLMFSEVFNSIVDKAMFQYGRFSNLSSTITTKASVEMISKGEGDDLMTRMSQATEGHEKALVIFLFISILYVVLLYTVFMKVFSLFMSLVTRFVNILMTSMYLPFHIALLGTENTKGLGARNIWSFVGDVLVTPLIAAFVGLAIIILGFFVSVIGTGDDSFLYFATGDAQEGYESVLFSGMLIMAILWGMLNKLQKLVEYVGANFENIIGLKGSGQGMQDSYSNPNEAMNAAGKVWDMSKTAGKYLGVAKGASMMGAYGMNKVDGVKSKVGNMMGKDPMKDQLLQEAKKEGIRNAISGELLDESMKAQDTFTKKGHNTKIN